MIVLCSERSIHYCLQYISALGELIDLDFSLVMLDWLYKVSDHLLRHKEKNRSSFTESWGQHVWPGRKNYALRSDQYILLKVLKDITPRPDMAIQKTQRLSFTMKTHKTMLKKQSVFSYPWVARIFWIRPFRFSNVRGCIGQPGFPKRSRIFEGNLSGPGPWKL